MVERPGCADHQPARRRGARPRARGGDLRRRPPTAPVRTRRRFEEGSAAPAPARMSAMADPPWRNSLAVAGAPATQRRRFPGKANGFRGSATQVAQQLALRLNTQRQHESRLPPPGATAHVLRSMCVSAPPGVPPRSPRTISPRTPPPRCRIGALLDGGACRPRDRPRDPSITSCAAHHPPTTAATHRRGRRAGASPTSRCSPRRARLWAVGQGFVRARAAGDDGGAARRCAAAGEAR